jgi:hypothetical protein
VVKPKKKKKNKSKVEAEENNVEQGAYGMSSEHSGILASSAQGRGTIVKRRTQDAAFLLPGDSIQSSS